jgi:hypothetical protein
VSSADPKVIREALFKPIHALFPGLRDEELRKVAFAFGDAPDGYLTRDDLHREQLTDELIDRAVAYHALVPDWLLEAHGYYLPPQLHFLARD